MGVISDESAPACPNALLPKPVVGAPKVLVTAGLAPNKPVPVLVLVVAAAPAPKLPKPLVGAAAGWHDQRQRIVQRTERVHRYILPKLPNPVAGAG